MKLNSVRYLVGEGFKNTWTNRLMTIASVGVLVACMVIMGIAVMISENLWIVAIWTILLSFLISLFLKKIVEL